MNYYRSDTTNPNWFDIWTEQINDGIPPEDILDELAELGCGIKIGASDTCQKYAKHIRTHIEAGFKAGQAYEVYRSKK